MTIRPWEPKDMPLVAKLLEEANLPGIPWSRSSQGEYDVPLWMTSPTEFLWVDDEEKQFCRISARSADQELNVVYLLPRADWGEDNMHKLRPLLAQTLKAALDARPDAREWLIWAEFQDAPNGGLDLCNAWRRFAPGTAVTYIPKRNRWRASWKLGLASAAVGSA